MVWSRCECLLHAPSHDSHERCMLHASLSTAVMWRIALLCVHSGDAAIAEPFARDATACSTGLPQPLREPVRCACRGWCELCCGRGCGFFMGPLRRYREAVSAGKYIPTLQVSNYMNHEAIVQVQSDPSEALLRVTCPIS